MVQSVMGHTFSQVPSAIIPRSSFNRSHGYKTTFTSGLLIPIFVDEALPGDTFALKMTGFTRMATPIHPIMDNLFMSTFFFAVPYRLVWDNWEKFNGAQDNPADSTDFLIPQMTAPATVGHANKSLSDYFGLPTEVADYSHSSLWHRAYNLVWNEWFRDENLQDSVLVDKDDGPDNSTDYSLLSRGKRHDYFTSALPWPQKGPSVELPLGTSAPVVTVPGLGTAGQLIIASNDGVTSTQSALENTSSGDLANVLPQSLYYDPMGTLETDLSAATAATVNQLREAFQVQKIYERDARGGTRYTELVKSHFGVTSPDQRLQRPEYLGGGSAPINIAPVPQTSETSAGTPQGSLAAIGTSVITGHGFTKSFTEHCLLIGLVSVRADLTYQQGLNRMFSRSTRWDYYWPSLSHIGEQEIKNKEIYMNNDANDELVFGYQERYAEYRYKPSQITGEFRSNFAQSLDSWHLSQDFGTLPLLNETFIVDKPPVTRVIAVPTAPEFIFDSYFDMRCARPMPVYGVPGMIDHF